MERYRTIVADPPWPYRDRGGLHSAPSHRPNSYSKPTSGVGSAVRYGEMSIIEICQLCPDSDQNAHLYLWTTNAFMVEAHKVAREWGFEPKTIITWVKIRGSDGKPSMKQGHYFRGATEHIIFAVKGKQKLIGKCVRPTAYLSPRLPHSVKPEWFYELVEEQSPGPYLEMFARRKRRGWYSWGNQIDSDPIHYHDVESLGNPDSVERSIIVNPAF